MLAEYCDCANERVNITTHAIQSCHYQQLQFTHMTEMTMLYSKLRCPMVFRHFPPILSRQTRQANQYQQRLSLILSAQNRKKSLTSRSIISCENGDRQIRRQRLVLHKDAHLCVDRLARNYHPSKHNQPCKKIMTASLEVIITQQRVCCHCQ